MLSPEDYLDPDAIVARNDDAFAVNRWLDDFSRDLRAVLDALWRVGSVEHSRLAHPAVRTYRDRLARTIPEEVAAIRDQAIRVCADLEATFPAEPEPEGRVARLLRQAGGR
jgi:hypothetical protein